MFYFFLLKFLLLVLILVAIIITIKQCIDEIEHLISKVADTWGFAKQNLKFGQFFGQFSQLVNEVSLMTLFPIGATAICIGIYYLNITMSWLQ